MDPISIMLMLAVAGWVVAAPDRTTLAASRGAAAATVSAVRAGWSTGRTASAARRAALPPRPAAARGNWLSGRPSTRPGAGTRPAGRTTPSTSTRPSTTSSSTTKTSTSTSKAGKSAGAAGKGGKGAAAAAPADTTSSTATAPAAGETPAPAAAAAAAAGPAPRVVWPTVRAAAGAARAGWGQGVTRARAARAAGTDPTSRIAAAVRVAVPVVAAAAAGVRAVPAAGRAAWASTAGTARVGGWRRLRVGHAVRAGLDGGADAWRAARRKQHGAGAGTDSAGPAEPGDDFAARVAAAAAEQARAAQARAAQATADEPTSGRGPTWVRCEVIPDPAPAPTPAAAPGEDDQDDHPGRSGWRVIPGEIVAGPTTTSTTTKETEMTTTSTGMTGDVSLRVTSGELACLGDLRGEIVQASGVLEELTPAVGALTEWAGSLPERLTEAGFSTSGLRAAIASVAETVGSLRCLGGLDDAADGLSVVVREIARAEALGEVADELGAEGRVEAFTEQ